jgi:hypothetical protein
MYKSLDNIKVVLINVGDVRLIDVDRGVDKCRIAMNIRCNEQIAPRQQVISKKVLNFLHYILT